MTAAPNKISAALQRRDFLRLSATASVVTTTACSAASLLDPGPPAGLIATGPIALDARRFHVLATLVDAMYPERPDFPAGLALGVPQRIDRELHFMARHTREQIELALDLLEYGGIFAGWFGRFSRLSPERKLIAVDAMFDHRWITYRQVATALTQLVKGMYFADPGSWKGIGYDGPFMPPLVPESIAAYPDYSPEKS